MSDTNSDFQTRLLIANSWSDSAGGKTLKVHNPATGHVVGEVACAGTEDLMRAVDAAQAGFDRWRVLSAIERGRLMRAGAALVRERKEQMARLITVEQGKPLAESLVEVAAAAEIIEWFADEACRVYGRVVPSRTPATQQQFMIKEPVGPVAAFTPWNFPITQVARKLGAALAAGCSFLLKAPEETPAAPAAFLRAFVDAGLPSGVVGAVYGDPAQISSFLIAHDAIRKVSFTGSTAVGKQLASLAGSHMKRFTMELGGHAPVIVCEDADIELAVRCCAAAKFRNAGQVCISPSRFIVHESVRAKFVQGLVDYAGRLKLGDGMDPTTTMGPLANPRRVEAMDRFLSDARERGADVKLGGERHGANGNFFLPTVVDDVPQNAALFNEEPFGPIAGICGFERLSDAIAEGNRLAFGLASYAFTRSLDSVQTLVRDLRVGMLWVNQAATPSAEMPFGGIKDSGIGTEGGPEAIEAYLDLKSVAIASSPSTL